MNFFVTAIDTDSGKTLVSAILCEALGADYWKPVQCGMPRDTDTVSALISNPASVFHHERHLLKKPASPHAAAKEEGIIISLSDFKIPETKRDIIIEGAGGCLVPLNDTDFIIDLIPRFDATVILVADLYLGSINHTLLTMEAIHKRNIAIKGIIFNGETNTESERIILKHASLPCLLKIKREQKIDKYTVKRYAEQLTSNWYE